MVLNKKFKAENRRNEERNERNDEDRREEAALTSRHITHTINVMSTKFSPHITLKVINHHSS